MSEFNPVVFLQSTGSTNDDARELAREGAPHGSAVAALEQTAGRGRRGHVWSSARGGLYLSAVLRPGVPMSCFTGIPAVCSLGVLDFLRLDLGVNEAALKWPNDVVVGERKLAGLLVEAGSGEGGAFAVCGIGLNVERPADEAPIPESPLALGRAYLSELMGEEPLPTHEAMARQLRDRIVARVDVWAAAVLSGRAAAGPLGPVLDEYFDACPLLGCEVDIVNPAGIVAGQGTFVGLDGWGRATVRLPNGRDVDYTSEMVSLRKRRAN